MVMHLLIDYHHFLTWKFCQIVSIGVSSSFGFSKIIAPEKRPVEL